MKYLTILIFSTLSIFVYKYGGLRGSLILLGIFCVSYIYFFGLQKYTKKKMTKKLDQMTERQIIDALNIMDKDLRVEVIAHMKKNPKKYSFVLKYYKV